MSNDTFSLETFEYLCYTRQHEPAARELVKLAMLIDRNYGQLTAAPFTGVSQAVPRAEQEQHVLTRLTSAITALFSDPSFHLSTRGFGQLINYQRWLSSLFAASHFVHADHILRSLSLGGPGSAPAQFHLKPADVVKFCLLYSVESELPLNIDALWQHDKDLAAALSMALLSPRFLGTPAAHAKREALLAWLPDKLPQLANLDVLPAGILHDVYMNCSYADLPQRHRIKGAINVLIERKLREAGIVDLDVSARATAAGKDKAAPKARKNIAPPADARVATGDSGTSTTGSAGGKPVMLVLLEWFSGGHSIYRTHSKTMEGARRHFHLVAMGYLANTDELGRGIFDEFIALESPEGLLGCLRQLRDVAARRRPAVFYMPSVGMFPTTMFAANMRLAPIQVAALGHPATTCSSRIDYISVEDDFVGDPACFSEKLLRLPADGQPYRPSAVPVEIPSMERIDRPVVQIAVAATSMKINPRFLAACRRIRDMAQAPPGGRAPKQVQFTFLIGQSQGLLNAQLSRLIQRLLPGAHCYQHQPYQQYLSLFNQCDMFLSPLPFGNTNGIIDAFTVGLPGVCKTGREVFEHIDEGLFRRAGMPDWTIAATLDGYIDAAVRMVIDVEARQSLYRYLEDRSHLQRLFEGRPESLGDALIALCGEPG